MSTRGRRGRGRPPRTPVSTPRAPVNLRKPKAYQNLGDSASESGSNSRCSTPTTRSSRKRPSTITKPVHRPVYGAGIQDEDDNFSYVSPHEDSDNSNTGESDNDMEFDNDMDDDNISEISESSLSTIGSLTRQKWMARMPPSPDIDEADIPDLNLPASATDLLIGNDLILEVLGVYEILRHYRIILRITPFRLEDFCMALVADEQSCLLSEIHISLMHALQREEENNTSTFGSHDVKDHVNISFYFLDPMTFPEVIRLYIESEKFQTEDMIKTTTILQSADYCSLKTSDRIHVLKTLTDMVLSTSAIRDTIMNEGKIQYDDHCRNCHR